MNLNTLPVQPLQQTEEALAAAIDTIAQAFSTDPTWSPIFVPEDKSLEISVKYWGFFVRSAQRYPWSFSVGTADAVSVWFPPNADELTAAEEERFPDHVAELIGAKQRDLVLEIGERFEATHPEEPHYYLSLLATHPSKRGSGIGMRLLAENLVEFDRLKMPTYLESSNPDNNKRYERLGYRPYGTIELPSGITLTTMWRDPQPTV